jgi:hypothetical protein
MGKTLDSLACSFVAFENVIYIPTLANDRQEYLSKETLGFERTEVAPPSNRKFFILFLR